MRKKVIEGPRAREGRNERHKKDELVSLKQQHELLNKEARSRAGPKCTKAGKIDEKIEGQQQGPCRYHLAKVA